LVLALCFFSPVAADQVLFTNVNVFDGVSDSLKNHDVLVEGNMIRQVGANIEVPEGALVIDGGGHTLMPGIIEGHGHLMLSMDAISWFNTHDVFYIGAAAAQEARNYLMRGWTTVRDIGGPVEGLHRAIEDGRIIGPRIYEHFSFIADGPAEVRRAVRESLRRGAVQIKVMAGGGVSSSIDPLYTVQYSAEELRAATEAVADYGTYVAVHAYNDTSIIRASENGVKVIEHGILMTEAAARVMVENDVWLMPSCQVLNLPEEAVSFLSEASRAKFFEAKDGLDNQMRIIGEYEELKVGFGTDLFGNPGNFAATPLEFTCLERYFTPYEVLRRATSINGEFLALTGKRNPYPDGPIGVIQAGAYADLLLVAGNPLEGTQILVDYEENIELIMKDGVIYKNTL
jgi:imidazolonepropionase-like amidohydrolase